MRAIKGLSLSLLAVALMTGCASSGRIGEGDKAIEGFARLRADLEKGQTQIDKTLTAMDQLSISGNGGGKDIAKSYKSFAREVDAVQKGGENAEKRAQTMRDSTEKYIDAWQKEMETIQDPTIKANLAQRREAVRSNFEQVRVAGQAAREAYDPFLRDLQEIEKALQIDLSPAALPGLRPAFDKAHQDGAVLKQRITVLQGELDKIQAGMGASMPAK